jgi:nitrogen-specific signal transduction histidine kinase
LLEARADHIPSEDDAFLVVDSSLSVQALSAQAEQLLAVGEKDAINKPISELLVPADAEAHELGFAASVIEAASGLDEPASGVVRPWNTFGVRIRVRISPCGPPRAALIVLDAPRQPGLRLVDA